MVFPATLRLFLKMVARDYSNKRAIVVLNSRRIAGNIQALEYG
jgi:hypothetical protein